MRRTPRKSLPNLEKKKVIQCPVLALPNFLSLLSWTSMRPMQRRGTQFNYSTYDKELYALVWALQVWRHCLLSNKFIVSNNHDLLKYLNGQHKLNKRHSKWVDFLEQFLHVIKHKQGKANVVADALSRMHALLELYVNNNDFIEAYDSCSFSANGCFFRHEGFLFKEKCLCVPKSSMRELLVKEAHKGGLMGHFGVRKTYKALYEHFYWPRMKRDIHHVCERCLVYKMAKSQRHRLVVCIALSQFLLHPGLTFLWTLCLDCDRLIFSRLNAHQITKANYSIVNPSSIRPNPIQFPHSSSQSISALGILMTIAKECFGISIGPLSQTSASQYQTCTSSIERNIDAAPSTSVDGEKQEQDNENDDNA
ncbi:Tf2-6, partial [Mucuna pruriens]